MAAHDDWPLLKAAGFCPVGYVESGGGPEASSQAPRRTAGSLFPIREAREVARFNGSTVALVRAPDC